MKTIVNLIQIRDYINNMVSNNYNLDKSKIKKLHKLLLTIDNKIIDLLDTDNELSSLLISEDNKS